MVHSASVMGMAFNNKKQVVVVTTAGLKYIGEIIVIDPELGFITVCHSEDKAADIALHNIISVQYASPDSSKK